MAQKLQPNDVEALFSELREIKDPRLRGAVAEIWCETAAEMKWDTLEEIPKNTEEEKGRSLIGHIKGVTAMALAICEAAKSLHGKEYDKDAMIAASLLHDVSKLVEYEPDPEKPRMANTPRSGRPSNLGKNVQHAVYAAHKMLNKGLSLELVNLVITHTHASGVRGRTWEAAALFYADFADSDAGLSEAKATLYSERWTLPH
jgi:putative nucleotidyltransferase with HDIG domain